MTKQELLQIMTHHGACFEAADYVNIHPSSDAAEIVGNCDRTDWLIWLMGREFRLVRFVRVCVKRAKRHAAYADAYADAVAYADDYDYAAYAADYAAYAAAYAAYADDYAAYAAAERAKQLVGLQRIARDWANGRPEEK